MKSVFLKEHHSMVSREINCIGDLCLRIKNEAESLNIDVADRFAKDLNNSLSNLMDLYKLQEKQADKKAEEGARWF